MARDGEGDWADYVASRQRKRDQNPLGAVSAAIWGLSIGRCVGGGARRFRLADELGGAGVGAGRVCDDVAEGIELFDDAEFGGVVEVELNCLLAVSFAVEVNFPSALARCRPVSAVNSEESSRAGR